MAPPITPTVSATPHQFNQFTSNFMGTSNPTYDSFRNQRSLPSPNLNYSQSLGLNGNPTTGEIKRIKFDIFSVFTVLNHD